MIPTRMSRTTMTLIAIMKTDAGDDDDDDDGPSIDVDSVHNDGYGFTSKRALMMRSMTC